MEEAPADLGKLSKMCSKTLTSTEAYITAPNLVNTVIETVNLAVAKLEALGHSASDIKTIGITNQRETAIVWSKSTGLPLHPAVVW